MSREDHIKELINYLEGQIFVMCPASRRYWKEHASDVQAVLERSKP